MFVVTESTFPKLYAQASQSARRWQNLLLALVSANIILMGAPAAVDMMFLLPRSGDEQAHGAHSHENDQAHVQLSIGNVKILEPTLAELLLIDQFLVVIAGLTTVIILFLPFKEDWLAARRLSETLKANSWRFMAKAQPYSGADDDALELFLAKLEELTSHHKKLAGSLSAEKVPNKHLGEIQSVRESSLEERIAIYKEHRIKDQVEYYSAKASDYLARHRFFSIAILVLQFLTFVSLVMDWSHEQITKSVALCIAATIGFLGWRDFRKYEEQSVAFGTAAQRLIHFETRANKIASEHEFGVFVNTVESILSREQKLWQLKYSEELDEEEEKRARSKTFGRFKQKPLEVTATQVDKKTVVKTPEGDEIANPGDWIVTGLKGEQWPISSSTFHKKYKAVPNKPNCFRKLPVEVDAAQMSNPFTIDTRFGMMSGGPSDWIVFADAHDSYVCKHEIFHLTYEPLET